MRFFECLTVQELLLLGSAVPAKYFVRPHTPIAVIEGSLSPEECDRWRQSVGFLEGCDGAYYGREGWARVTIEQLDLDEKSPTYGTTVQDPQLLVLRFRHEGRKAQEPLPFRRST